MAGFALTACDDETGSYVNGNDVGSPCSCEGEGCAIGEIPLPHPTKGTIVGCENVDMTGITGGELVCLQSISQDASNIAPPTYFPQGYCAISAVSCTGNTFCAMASYGSVETFDRCPAGHVLIDSTFQYAIMEKDSVIVNKTCVKSCESNADCNGDGEIYCLKREGHRFCYNENNFDFLCNSEDDCSNVTYTEF